MTRLTASAVRRVLADAQIPFTRTAPTPGTTGVCWWCQTEFEQGTGFGVFCSKKCGDEEVRSS